MTDDPTMPLPKPPSEDPGETLRPVRPVTTGGETEAISPGTDASAAAELKVSSRRIKVRKLGPYELLGMLGRGGMGAVYEAFDTRLNRRVALKVMLASDEATAEERERFRREAAHSAKLRHPNIVPVHDVGHEDGRDYLVMDLVEGVTLGEALRQRQFTYREKAALLEKVARAVQYAHAQGVIHRDLKPGNIMLDYGRGGSSTLHSSGSKPLSQAPTEAPLSKAETVPQAKLVDVSERSASSSLVPDVSKVAPAFFEPLVMDFGLAKDTQQESGLSHTGQALGTPAYMAPEQAEGKAKLVGPRSDVYSLGAILYEMLAGRPPFVGENALQVMRAALHEEPVPPRVFTPGVPRDLETICLKCLEKEPGRRYASAAEFADDLKAFQHDEPISARPVGAAERAWKKVRKNPAPYLVAAVAMVVIVAGTAAFMWSLNEKRLEAEASLARFLAEKEQKEKAEQARLALEKEKSREWQLIFEDDFSDPDRSKANWEIFANRGKWEIKNGELHVWGGEPQVAVLKVPITGDVKLEFECHQENDCLSDVSCYLLARPIEVQQSEHEGGYVFQFGGGGNTWNSIARLQAVLKKEPAAPLIKGQHYHACAEKVGDRLRYSVNGKVVLEATDSNPLQGEIRSVAGICGYKADTYWDNVKVFRLGEAASADLLDVAQRHLDRGHAATACELFKDVLASASDPVRHTRAKDGIEKANLLSMKQECLDRWRIQVQRAWARATLEIDDFGLTVEIKDCGVTDLSPLRGLPITVLRCNKNDVSSLDPLRGMPLRILDIEGNHITSLEPLSAMAIERLSCAANRIADLGPLLGMRLTHLNCSSNQITILDPLKGMPLEHLVCPHNLIAKLDPLRGAPLVYLDCSDNHITDLAPLRGMSLDGLVCAQNEIMSLEPLGGMPLAHLYCGENQIASLEPLRGMRLTRLVCGANQIESLEPLRGMSLTSLELPYNKVTGLEPLRGMRFTEFTCYTNRITSLEPLRGMPLVKLVCDGNLISSLEPLNGMPLAVLAFDRNQVTTLDPLRGMSLSYLRCGDNPLNSLEPFVETPPKQFWFGGEGLSTEELSRVQGVWAQDPRHGRHAHLAAVWLALCQQDRARLRALATPFGGHRYLLLPKRLHYEEAKALCRALGGHLVTLTSAEENSFAETLIPAEWAAWVGLCRRDGQLEWITGEPVGYRHFSPNGSEMAPGPWRITQNGVWIPVWRDVDQVTTGPSIIEWDE